MAIVVHICAPSGEITEGLGILVGSLACTRAPIALVVVLVMVGAVVIVFILVVVIAVVIPAVLMVRVVRIGIIVAAVNKESAPGQVRYQRVNSRFVIVSISAMLPLVIAIGVIVLLIMLIVLILLVVPVAITVLVALAVTARVSRHFSNDIT